MFISDGKKFRWEPTGPGGEYVPKEEPLTDADVQAISESLLLLCVLSSVCLCVNVCAFRPSYLALCTFHAYCSRIIKSEVNMALVVAAWM